MSKNVNKSDLDFLSNLTDDDLERLSSNPLSAADILAKLEKAIEFLNNSTKHPGLLEILKKKLFTLKEITGNPRQSQQSATGSAAPKATQKADDTKAFPGSDMALFIQNFMIKQQQLQQTILGLAAKGKITAFGKNGKPIVISTAEDLEEVAGLAGEGADEIIEKAASQSKELEKLGVKTIFKTTNIAKEDKAANPDSASFAIAIAPKKFKGRPINNLAVRREQLQELAILKEEENRKEEERRKNNEQDRDQELEKDFHDDYPSNLDSQNFSKPEKGNTRKGNYKQERDQEPEEAYIPNFYIQLFAQILDERAFYRKNRIEQIFKKIASRDQLLKAAEKMPDEVIFGFSNEEFDKFEKDFSYVVDEEYSRRNSPLRKDDLGRRSNPGGYGYDRGNQDRDRGSYFDQSRDGRRGYDRDHDRSNYRSDRYLDSDRDRGSSYHRDRHRDSDRDRDSYSDQSRDGRRRYDRDQDRDGRHTRNEERSYRSKSGRNFRDDYPPKDRNHTDRGKSGNDSGNNGRRF